MANDPNQLHPPIGYICPKCNARLYGSYRPFCTECGQHLPPERKLQLCGLTIYPFRYGRPIEGMKQIAAFLRDTGDAKHWLQEYHPTFRTTKIRIQATSRKGSDYDIVCTGTMRLELPIDNGWHGSLTLKCESDGTISLTDEKNDVFVVSAGSISLCQVKSN